MQKRVLALGFFDGVHLGHAALLSRVSVLAAANGAIPAALTFSAHPSALFSAHPAKLLTDVPERVRLLREHGMQEVLVLPFDRELAGLDWRSFAETVLIERFQASALVCGEDFGFGSQKRGTAEKLRSFCRERGIACEVVPKVRLDGEVVSSTGIRALLEQGDAERAARLLDHPFTLCGTVAEGNRIGRTIGVPTANVPFPENGVVPAFGVYDAEVTAEGANYRALVNVGVHPTVSPLAVPIAEAWLKGFDGDLYGKTIRIAFLRRLREERKFASLDELKTQLLRDAETLK